MALNINPGGRGGNSIMNNAKSDYAAGNGPATDETMSSRLSYKFQRLREKLREAVASGELSGKLPGERALARRFNVNAKTLSKALTDLAAEGLLDRSIGRGTFVKGTVPQESKLGRWLILCDRGTCDLPIVQKLLGANPEAETAEDVATMRPSFINQFNAVVDLASSTPESFLRGLVVRNIPVIAVGREPKTYSVNTVVMDRMLGLQKMGRDLMLAGHRRFAAVEARGSTLVAQALRQTARHYAIDASVDGFLPAEVGAVVDSGITAVVCDSIATATVVTESLRKLDVDVPGQLSVAAVGSAWQQKHCPCTGYYATAELAGEAILELLRDTQPRRPVTLWLAGTLIDKDTTSAADGVIRESELPLQITAAVAV